MPVIGTSPAMRPWVKMMLTSKSLTVAMDGQTSRNGPPISTMAAPNSVDMKVAKMSASAIHRARLTLSTDRYTARSSPTPNATCPIRVPSSVSVNR